MVLERRLPVGTCGVCQACSHTKDVRILFINDATEDFRRVERVCARPAQQLEERIMPLQRHKFNGRLHQAGPQAYDTGRAATKNPLRKAILLVAATAFLGDQVCGIGRAGRAQ